MSLSRKKDSFFSGLNVPVLFYAASLSIIFLTVVYALTSFHDRSKFISDLTEQRHIISELEVNLATMREGITQLLFLDDTNDVALVLTKADDLEFSLTRFKAISMRYQFLNDISYIDEVEPILEDLSAFGVEIVSLGSRGDSLQARKVFEERYLASERQIRMFSDKALYGKSELIESSLEQRAATELIFSVVFVLEIIATLGVTCLIHFKVTTALRKVASELRHQASYDPLTGLYNRRVLLEHIEHAIAISKRHRQCFGIYYFDIDDFKKINDTWGHAIGDQLLKSVADRISSQIRESDTFSRLGGDEFVLLAEEIDDVVESEKLVVKIMKVFSDEFNVGQQSVKLTSSIGISLYPENGTEAEELIQNADTAMYRAKSSGRNTYKRYSSSMTEAAGVRLALENDIMEALRKEEFVLYYQPKIDPRSGTMSGAEALIRWIHPEKGFISPGEFIPVAEKSDLIIDIGRWVREEVMAQLDSWQKNDFPMYKISVNVSGKEFAKNQILPHLIDLFQRYDIDESLLELEITEGTLMIGEGQENGDLGNILDMDVSLSIDDFGTGYCSLGYLKQHPIDTLKIDKSFIDNITTDERDAAIAKTIISLAHSLDMSVVAEGVEDEAQRDFLLKNDCDQIQGYYYSPPLPVEKFEDFARPIAGSRYTRRYY